MSRGLAFTRKFFILKRKFSNIRGISPKGHGRLELRNDRLRIIINVENAERNESYKIVLLREGKIKELGRLHTDNNSKGRVEFNLNYREFESTGFPLEKINGILILREDRVLLAGYMDEEDGSIEKHIARLSQDRLQDSRPEKPLVEEDIDEEVKEKDKEEKDTEKEDGLEKAKPEQDIAEIDKPELNIPENPLLEDEVSDEDKPFVSVEEYDKAMQEMFKDVEMPSNIEESPQLSAEAKRRLDQKNQTTNYVLNILAFFPYIEPFKIDLKGYNWWRIDIDDPREDKGFLPYFSYIAGGDHKYPLVQNTVTATALMKKYGHYIFGLYNVEDEVKFYVYGVPGYFTKEDHPQRGTTGFNAWFEGKDGIGYWLLYIDPTNGRVIYPINPMIPKE